MSEISSELRPEELQTATSSLKRASMPLQDASDASEPHADEVSKEMKLMAQLQDVSTHEEVSTPVQDASEAVEEVELGRHMQTAGDLNKTNGHEGVRTTLQDASELHVNELSREMRIPDQPQTTGRREGVGPALQHETELSREKEVSEQSQPGQEYPASRPAVWRATQQSRMEPSSANFQPDTFLEQDPDGVGLRWVASPLQATQPTAQRPDSLQLKQLPSHLVDEASEPRHNLGQGLNGEGLHWGLQATQPAFCRPSSGQRSSSSSPTGHRPMHLSLQVNLGAGLSVWVSDGPWVMSCQLNATFP